MKFQSLYYSVVDRFALKYDIDDAPIFHIYDVYLFFSFSAFSCFRLHDPNLGVIAPNRITNNDLKSAAQNIPKYEFLKTKQMT